MLEICGVGPHCVDEMVIMGRSELDEESAFRKQTGRLPNKSGFERAVVDRICTHRPAVYNVEYLSV
jgi:hypothetical protein